MPVIAIRPNDIQPLHGYLSNMPYTPPSTSGTSTPLLSSSWNEILRASLSRTPPPQSPDDSGSDRPQPLDLISPQRSGTDHEEFHSREGSSNVDLKDVGKSLQREISSPEPLPLDTNAPKTLPISRKSLPPIVGNQMEAGPSNALSNGTSRSAISPPPIPRRHRSGVIMSQVRHRAHTGGNKSVTNSPKGFGEIGLVGSGGLQMSSMDLTSDQQQQQQDKYWRRVTSEGSSSLTNLHSRRNSRRTSGDDDDGMWDNR